MQYYTILLDNGDEIKNRVLNYTFRKLKNLMIERKLKLYFE